MDVDEIIEHCSKTLYCWKHADYKDLLQWKSLEMYYKHIYVNSHLLKLKLNLQLFSKRISSAKPMSYFPLRVLFKVFLCCSLVRI